MQTEHKEAERPEGVGTVICPSCRTELVAGLRFCRMCGFRLGEGVEEFTETRRFDGRTPPHAPPAEATKDAPPLNSAYQTWTAAPLAPQAPYAPVARPDSAQGWRWTNIFKPWRMGWVGWVVLSLVLIVVIGLVNPTERDDGRRESPVESQLDDIQTADGGGAFIVGLDGPGTSFEQAGLLGGDVITSFDGQPVRNERALRRLLRRTPVGKAVEVVYVREGETRTTTLTIADPQSYRGREVLGERPGGEGRIDVSVGDRVRVPVLNTHGVELDGVGRNGPADLAGLKRGDIVLEFNGKPTRTPGDLRLRIYEAEPGSTVIAKVLRGAEQLEIPVKVGRSRDDED